MVAVMAVFYTTANAQQWNRLNSNSSNSITLLTETPVNRSVFETDGTVINRTMIRKTEEHWRKLRNNGIVLTSLGAACVIVGTALVQADVYDVDGNADGTRALFGAMGIAGGITSLGGGITMWAIGANRLRKINDVSIKTNGKALGIAYRF